MPQFKKLAKEKQENIVKIKQEKLTKIQKKMEKIVKIKNHLNQAIVDLRTQCFYNLIYFI